MHIYTVLPHTTHGMLRTCHCPIPTQLNVLRLPPTIDKPTNGHRLSESTCGRYAAIHSFRRFVRLIAAYAHEDAQGMR